MLYGTKRMNKEDSTEGNVASAVEPQIPGAPVSEELVRTAGDPELSEDLALALLKHAELSAEVLEILAKNGNALKSRKVKIALVSHARTPRHVSVPLARQLYTFEMMKVALSAMVPADVKVAVDDLLISRLNTVTVGERLTLARRGSGRVAAALLTGVESGSGKTKKVDSAEAAAGKSRKGAGADTPELRVMRTALENPRLTEAMLTNAVLGSGASVALVQAVARHEKWSLRKEIRAALLRTEHLSLARALEFGSEIPMGLRREILASSRLPEKIKEQLLRESGSVKPV
jgi:hypothetical protein